MLQNNINLETSTEIQIAPLFLFITDIVNFSISLKSIVHIETYMQYILWHYAFTFGIFILSFQKRRILGEKVMKNIDLK